MTISKPERAESVRGFPSPTVGVTSSPYLSHARPKVNTTSRSLGVGFSHRLLLGFIIVVILSFFLGYFISENHVIEQPTYVGVSGSGSMLPSMQPDVQLKTVELEENATLKCGHIYIYQNNDSRVVHRFVYELKNGNLIFKGDNNQYQDKPIERSQILYEVTGIELP